MKDKGKGKGKGKCLDLKEVGNVEITCFLDAFIPKHSVIVWMAILNKLPTMDRLASWGLEVNETCCLCQRSGECRDHLFFGCRFSRSIWEKILSLSEQSRLIRTWSEDSGQFRI